MVEVAVEVAALVDLPAALEVAEAVLRVLAEVCQQLCLVP
jgi:hypothetical protein